LITNTLTRIQRFCIPAGESSACIDRVISFTAKNGVITAARDIKSIIAFATFDGIIARSGNNTVVTVFTVDDVIATIGKDGVVSGACVNEVVSITKNVVVVSFCAVDGYGNVVVCSRKGNVASVGSSDS